MTDAIVIPKNAHEEIRVERSEFKGHDLVQMRVWYQPGIGEQRPGNKGLAVKADKVPQLIDALSQVAGLEGVS